MSSGRSIFDWPILLAGILAFGWLGWWAVYAGPDFAGKFETRLEDAANSALLEAGIEWAGVRVDGQSAVMSGQAPNADEANDALQVVATAVGRGGWLYGGIVSVSTNFSMAPGVSPFTFSATRAGNGLVLSGFVPNRALRERLLEAGRIASPDGQVEDRLTIAAGEPDGDWVAAAELAIASVADLLNGASELTDTAIFVAGEAPDYAALRAVRDRLRNAPAGFTADSDIETPTIWGAFLQGDRLELRGLVPDANTKRQLLVLAERFYDGAVLDGLTSASMPDDRWLSGVRAALPQFARFQSGRLTFDGEAVVISGQATESVLDYLREDLVRLTEGVNLRIEAEPIAASVAGLDTLSQADTPRPACDEAYSEALGDGVIGYTGRDQELSRESGRVLDRLVAVAERCSPLGTRITGLTFINGNQVISRTDAQVRADRIADYLIAKGIAPEQVEVTIARDPVPAPPSAQVLVSTRSGN